ncbi:MAG TPA: TonB family protein [Candidatus Acidoferrales bacterium]|nr:TonB family protein [Candidatus Acidoferrales bacterium]
MNESWKQWEGQVVGGEFPLRQYLGGSDHSAVYLTEAGGPTPQKATIKLIAADPGTAELQISRWNLALKLSHPHLLRILHLGRCQLGGTDLLYLVMEYADEDLSQLLPYRALAPSEAREMLVPVLNALGYIHAQGFVHGRMKPANILAREDQIRISSDSLYHLDEWGGRLVKPGLYDPPEAASGGITPVGDVWSLGMILAEALTQRLPAWEKAGQADPALPDTLPEPFLEIVRQCLRRDPRQRPAVAEIAARLQPAPAVRPAPVVPAPVVRARTIPAPVKKTPAPPRPPATLPSQPGIGSRTVVVGVVGVFLVLVTVFGWTKLFQRRAELQRPASAASEPSPEDTTAPLKAQPKAAPGAKRTAQQSAKNLATEKPSPVRTAPSPAALKSETPRTPSEGFTPGEILEQVLPAVSQKATDTIHGTVRVSVRVRVDPAGNVAGVDFDSPGPSRYFADQALTAARRWEFVPAKVNGQYVSTEWVLRFHYTQAGTKVFPVQASP